MNKPISRRTALSAGALGSLAAALPASADVPVPKRITKGRIKQSIMAWTYNKVMSKKELAALCADIGISAMEGLGPENYPLMKEHGLGVSLTGSHGFGAGPTDPKNHANVIKKIREGIDLAKKWGAPGVITFTGMKVDGMSRDEMWDNCIKAWKQVLPYAEEQGINVVLEHLNSRDGSHPMTGHPGYLGDDVDEVAEVIRSIDSPKLKLLFDIYHVQIMNGDVIKRIHECKDIIGHVHTAGVPGRHELDENQELQYPPIMRALLDIGYTGYVAQEFLPTWDDPAAALRAAAVLCDV